MANKRPKAPAPSRKRYTEIRATNIEEAIAICETHIRNIGRTQMDYIEEGDGTPTDDFYCNMIRGMWQDMRDDLTEILAAQQEKREVVVPPSPIQLKTVAVVEMTEHERGWGQRPDGYMLFLEEKDAKAYIHLITKDRDSKNVPDEYVSYNYLGHKECTHALWERVLKSNERRVYIDKLAQLKGP